MPNSDREFWPNSDGSVHPSGCHLKGMPTGSIARGQLQMQDGEPVCGAIGQMKTPIMYT